MVDGTRRLRAERETRARACADVRSLDAHAPEPSVAVSETGPPKLFRTTTKTTTFFGRRRPGVRRTRSRADIARSFAVGPERARRGAGRFRARAFGRGGSRPRPPAMFPAAAAKAMFSDDESGSTRGRTPPLFQRLRRHREASRFEHPRTSRAKPRRADHQQEVRRALRAQQATGGDDGCRRR